VRSQRKGFKAVSFEGSMTGVEPVGSGLVASPSRPGGNVTGIGSIAESRAPKRVQLLLQAAPKMRCLGLLGDPNDPTLGTEHAALAALGSTLGVATLPADATNRAEFDAAAEGLIGQRTDAILTESAFAFNMRSRLLELIRNKAFADRRPSVANGRRRALLAHGASLELPAKFELIVNMKTAKALGIAIPASIVLRADRVIE
jgi:putative ABC transport system substrate-binding protein